MYVKELEMLEMELRIQELENLVTERDKRIAYLEAALSDDPFKGLDQFYDLKVLIKLREIGRLGLPLYRTENGEQICRICDREQTECWCNY